MRPSASGVICLVVCGADVDVLADFRQAPGDGRRVLPGRALRSVSVARFGRAKVRAVWPVPTGTGGPDQFGGHA